MVLLRAPVTWGHYKHLLAVHIVFSAVFDQVISFSEVIPYLPLPLVRYRYHRSPECMGILAVLAVGSLFALICYRHQVILPPNHRLRFGLRTFIILAFTLTILAITTGFLLYNYLKSWKTAILRRLFKVWECVFVEFYLIEE